MILAVNFIKHSGFYKNNVAGHLAFSGWWHFYKDYRCACPVLRAAPRKVSDDKHLPERFSFLAAAHRNI
jgi:hypothetical protein